MPVKSVARNSERPRRCSVAAPFSRSDQNPFAKAGRSMSQAFLRFSGVGSATSLSSHPPLSCMQATSGHTNLTLASIDIIAGSIPSNFVPAIEFNQTNIVKFCLFVK